MRSLFIAALATLALASYGAEDNRPIGPNCALEAPPAEAGEDSNHGRRIRVFPRAKDIGADYSGCQAVFMEDHGKWVVWYLVEIASGYPLRVWSEFGSGDPIFSCRYSKGNLVRGDPDSCPAAQLLLKN